MVKRADQELLGKVWGDRYEILELIGRGGMGTVFKARQLQINREVALKVIHRKLTQDEKQVMRFEREAMASSRLNHPNNIRVYDYGKGNDGRLFIAMEYLRGQTLADLIADQGALPAERVVHILRQLLKALAEAHQLSLVHRDLKPENIFLTEVYGEKDFVKVLDFGIAKSLTGEKESADLTQTGFICGTPRYISPEQALGQPVDARADLYAVAVLAYEMLTGRPPFLGENPISIVMKHVYDDPPPLTGMERYGDLGRRLTGLVAALLEKNPARRPDSAERILLFLDGKLDLPELLGREPSADGLPNTGKLPPTNPSGASAPPPLPPGAEGGEATAILSDIAALVPGNGGVETAVMQRPESLRSFAEASQEVPAPPDPSPASEVVDAEVPPEGATMMLDAAGLPEEESPPEGATSMMSQEELGSALKEYERRKKRQGTGLVRRPPTGIVRRPPTGAFLPMGAPSTGPALQPMPPRSGPPTWALVASGVAISVIILSLVVYFMANRDKAPQVPQVAAATPSSEGERRTEREDEAPAESSATTKATTKATATAGEAKGESEGKDSAPPADKAEEKASAPETPPASPASGQKAGAALAAVRIPSPPPAAAPAVAPTTLPAPSAAPPAAPAKAGGASAPSAKPVEIAPLKVDAPPAQPAAVKPATVKPAAPTPAPEPKATKTTSRKTTAKKKTRPKATTTKKKKKKKKKKPTFSVF